LEEVVEQEDGDDDKDDVGQRVVAAAVLLECCCFFFAQEPNRTCGFFRRRTGSQRRSERDLWYSSSAEILASALFVCLFVGVRWGFCELCSLFCLCRIDESVSLGFLLDIPGRSWKASELRNKSWEDLHQLWYVMLKEKNLLLSQRQMLLSQNYRMPNPERVPKVNLPSSFVLLPSLLLYVICSILVIAENRVETKACLGFQFTAIFPVQA
jgi:hypothetical protein